MRDVHVAGQSGPPTWFSIAFPNLSSLDRGHVFGVREHYLVLARNASSSPNSTLNRHPSTNLELL